MSAWGRCRANAVSGNLAPVCLQELFCARRRMEIKGRASLFAAYTSTSTTTTTSPIGR